MSASSSMRVRSVVTLIVVLSIVTTVVGCGGGNDAASPTATTPSTFPVTSAEADKRATTAMVLTQGDLPADYLESTRYRNLDQSDDSATSSDAELPKACENADLDHDTVANSNGKLFVKNETTPTLASVIFTGAGLYENAEMVEDRRAAFASKGNQLCVRRILEELVPLLADALGTKSGVQNVAISTLPKLTSADSIGFRITGSTAVERQTANFSFDAITVFADRAELIAGVVSLGAAPSDDVHQHLLGKLRAKVSAGITAAQQPATT